MGLKANAPARGCLVCTSWCDCWVYRPAGRGGRPGAGPRPGTARFRRVVAAAAAGNRPGAGRRRFADTGHALGLPLRGAVAVLWLLTERRRPVFTAARRRAPASMPWRRSVSLPSCWSASTSFPSSTTFASTPLATPVHPPCRRAGTVAEAARQNDHCGAATPGGGGQRQAQAVRLRGRDSGDRQGSRPGRATAKQGPQFEVVLLDPEHEDYEQKLAAVTKDKPKLAQALERRAATAYSFTLSRARREASRRTSSG